MCVGLAGAVTVAALHDWVVVQLNHYRTSLLSRYRLECLVQCRFHPNVHLPEAIPNVGSKTSVLVALGQYFP